MKNLFAQIDWQHDDATGFEVVAHFGNVIVVVVGNVDEDIARLKRVETCHGAIPIESTNLVDLDSREFSFNSKFLNLPVVSCDQTRPGPSGRRGCRTLVGACMCCRQT